MVTAILLSGDSKLASQVEMWVRQTMPERVRLEAYKSLEDYKKMLEEARSIVAVPDGANSSSGPTGTAGAKLEVKGKIRVFIVDIDIIQQKPFQWISDLQKLTKELGGSMVDETPSVFMMAYDGGVHRLDSFQNDVIDDLILKPIEKTLFLQKLEFLTSETTKVNPTLLFRAKTSQTIEIGRDVTIDEISEFAVSVRSPGPVPDGAFASIHCEVFGSKNARRLIGRVYESVNHPVREGEYLVRFGYFGISPEQLSTIRRYIKANQTQMRTKTWTSPASPNQSQGASAPGKPAFSKELLEKMALLKNKKLAVIDLNPETLTEAKSILETGFKGVVVRPFASYMRFAAEIRKLVPETTAKQSPSAATPLTPTPALTQTTMVPVAFSSVGKKLVIILRGKTFEAVRFEPPLRKLDTVLGRLASEWLEKPDQWAQAIDRGDREAFEEFVNFVERGVPGRAYFRMIDSKGQLVHFDAKGLLEKSGSADGAALIRVELNEIDREEFNKAISAGPAATPNAAKDPAFFRFEAILMDAAFVRQDASAWLAELVDLLRAAKVLGPLDPPPQVYLMADPKSNPRLDDFRVKGIADFIPKPIDRRYLLQKIQALCQGLVPTREPEGNTFVPCELQATLGKEVTMEEVAEYGVNITHPSPFKNKSFMRFFSPLFGGDGQWVTGRFHGSEKAKEGENYNCQFMFFGPHDELLQRIRRWIREDFVAKKEKSSN